MTSDYIVIGLPIVLFAVTLAIIFILRASDNTKRSVQTVKAMIEGYKKEMDSEKVSRTQELADANMKFSNIDTAINSKIQTLTGQIRELQNYNEDFSKLGKAMTTYESSLTAIAKLTRSADDKLSHLEKDIEEMESIRQTIAEFKAEMQKMEEELTAHEEAVKALEKESIDHITVSVDNVSQACSEDVGILIKRMEETFHNASEQSRKLISEMAIKTEAAQKAFELLAATGGDVLNSIVDKSADQMLVAARIEELSNQRDTLLTDIATLQQQYDEAKEAVTLEEAESAAAATAAAVESLSEKFSDVLKKEEKAESEVPEEPKEPEEPLVGHIGNVSLTFHSIEPVSHDEVEEEEKEEKEEKKKVYEELEVNQDEEIIFD
ncbi:MAG: hypothetical protein K6F82_05650 [Sphaerochaetaceae bacterium]|nr:hypothetical protein [Sphaerochaetaceae bacterium]